MGLPMYRQIYICVRVCIDKIQIAASIIAEGTAFQNWIFIAVPIEKQTKFKPPELLNFAGLAPPL